MNKIVEFNISYVNGKEIVSVIVLGFLRFIATESDRFQGGWDVMTANQTKVGWFQTLHDIEVMINGK